MKKFFTVILTVATMLTFVGCGDKDKDTKESLANTSWKATVNAPLPLDDSIMSRLPFTPTIDINMMLNFIDESKGHMKLDASIPSSLGAFAALIEQYLGSYLDEFSIDNDFTYTFDGVSKGEVIIKDTDDESGETETSKQEFTYNGDNNTIVITVDDETRELVGSDKLTFSKQ